MAAAPRSSGVYIMKDAQERVIYVGKANDLKNRLGSYLAGRDTRPMLPFLLAKVSDIEFITTVTAKEALILENNLIKKHRPRYNVFLRDDKTYYLLMLDPADKFPRLHLVRKRSNSSALYFGPYPSGLAAKETLRFVQKVFLLRSCRNREFQLRTRPCLEYQIKRCLAPCGGLIKEEEYRKLTDSAVSFLKGRKRELISELKRQMREASEDLNYEEAALLRNRVTALENILERQNVEGAGAGDKDVFGISGDNDVYQLCILFVRGGKLLGRKSFLPVRTKADMTEFISAALKQYYLTACLPEEIMIPGKLPDAGDIAEWLSDSQKKKVSIAFPRRGAKKALLDMACANARELLAAARKKETMKEELLEILRDRLSLSTLPRRIEGYDISNISGKNAVGAMAVFANGEPDKLGYRLFRLRADDRPDDYAMMRQLLARRFAGVEPKPDLIVIDGGKGQLNVALTVLKDLQIKADVVGLAKEKRPVIAGKSSRRLKVKKHEDRVYLPGRKDPVYLSSLPEALSALQWLRDEAHRIALSYHRRLREKIDLRSALDVIPSVGGRRKKALLRHFGSLQQVRNASINELASVPGIGRELAEKIYSGLRGEGAERK